jgi:rhodanese-related sulfurtransferase
MIDMKILALTFALAISTLLAAAGEQFPAISTDQLKTAIKENKVTLLDVNGTESWQERHIPGALDFEAAGAALAAKLPADKSALVVAYCGNERCTAYKAGAQAAKKLGYTNVKHYAKGIQGWVKAGESTEKAK